MRWLYFGILAYLMLGLQLGLAGLVRIDFVLIAVAFIAINARRDAALPACFALGLIYDLLGGISPIGSYALAYSMVALMMAGTDQALSVEHPFTHFIVTLAGGLVTSAILLAIAGWREDVAMAFWPTLLGVLYTALAALPVLWMLTKFRRTFRFKTSVG